MSLHKPQTCQVSTCIRGVCNGQMCGSSSNASSTTDKPIRTSVRYPIVGARDRKVTLTRAQEYTVDEVSDRVCHLAPGESGIRVRENSKNLWLHWERPGLRQILIVKKRFNPNITAHMQELCEWLTDQGNLTLLNLIILINL